MANIFLVSDQHFGHKNIITFMRDDGITPLRPFTSVEEMDEAMVENHNSVVRPQDKVYFLGDVAFTKKAIAIVARLNGEKILIKGNHDKLRLIDYTPYFKDVRGSHQFDGILMTHIPVHPNSLGRWPLNVHGHLHSNSVTQTIVDMSWYGSKTVPDPRYFSACVEHHNYTPISLEDLKIKAAARLEKYS